MQRQIGRYPVLLAVELHGLQDRIAEHLGCVRTEVDRLHVGRIAADRVGRDEVHVEGVGPGRHVGLELVEEAVAVEEQQLDLVGIGRGLVVEIDRRAKRGLLRATGPTENRHRGVAGTGKRQSPQNQRRGGQRV